MILRYLRYFAAAAEHGSVGRAAGELRVAQPALSRQLQKLEREVGAALFIRERQGVRLTPTGTALLEGAQTLFAHLELALRRARLAHQGRLGTVRLGLGRVAVASSAVGHAIAEIRAEFPEIELVVSEVPAVAQQQALLVGELHVAIGVQGSRTDASLRYEVLFPDAVDRALLPADHPLARSATLRPAQLKGERLVMMRAVAARYPELYEGLRELGFRVWEEHDSLETVYSLVAAGQGWTTHMRSVAAPGGTVTVPLEGLDVPMSVVVLWNAADTSPLTANIVEAFRRRSAEMGGVDHSTVRPRLHHETPAPAQATPLRNLELRHLRALTVVAEDGSVRHAARRLGLTQSGLARQLRALEREVGFPLLRREAGEIVPTPGGEVLRCEASAAMALVDDVVARARRTGRGMTRRCHIGVIPRELSGDLLSGALKVISNRLPDIEVEVREMLSPRQIAALRARDIDIGIASAIPGLVDDPAIDSLLLVRDALECALVATTHPLASRASVQPLELAAEPFLFVDRATFPLLYDAVLGSFQQLGLVPQMNGSFNGPRTLWRLAADSMGWTIGTRSQRTQPPPGVVAIPIEGFHVPTGAELLWRRDETNPNIQSVIAAFRAARPST